MPIKIEGIDEDDLRRMYVVNFMSLKNIAKYYGVTYQTIWMRLKEYGIKCRSPNETKLANNSNRTYNINTDFFKTLNKESSWLYGWILGDGHCGIDSIVFDIHQRDEEVLHKFKTALESEHPIINTKQWKQYGKYYYSSCIRFCSKLLVDSIKDFSYHSVPETHIPDFFRGFFEAEGSIFWHKNNRPKGGNISSNFSQNDYDILNFIWTKLKENNVVTGGGLSKYKNTWKLAFRVKDTLSLYHFIYDNCGDLYLPRKKHKFEELIDRQLS